MVPMEKPFATIVTVIAGAALVVAFVALLRIEDHEHEGALFEGFPLPGGFGFDVDGDVPHVEPPFGGFEFEDFPPDGLPFDLDALPFDLDALPFDLESLPFGGPGGERPEFLDRFIEDLDRMSHRLAANLEAAGIPFEIVPTPLGGDIVLFNPLDPAVWEMIGRVLDEPRRPEPPRTDGLDSEIERVLDEIDGLERRLDEANRVLEELLETAGG